MDGLLHAFHVRLVGPRRAVVIHPVGDHWPAIIDAGRIQLSSSPHAGRAPLPIIFSKRMHIHSLRVSVSVGPNRLVRS